MRALRLPLLVLAASLGLAACDYRNETVTRVNPPTASLPDDAVLRPQASASAAAPATEQPATPADATPAPAQSTANAAPDMNATATAPVATAPAPDTNAMGAQPAAVASDGTAAPTELGRFLEETASKGSAGRKAS